MYHLAICRLANCELQQSTEYVGMSFPSNLRFVLNVSTSSEIFMDLYACSSGLGGVPTLRPGSGGNNCKQGMVSLENKPYYLFLR